MTQSPDDPAGRRVFLHIGLHKTGTTYLQRLWAANRRRLAKEGVCFPGGRGEVVQRHAALDLLGQRPRGTTDRRLTGQWDALCEVVTTAPETTGLVSAEGLSVADRAQATTAAAGFRGAELHVVVTCRDLARSLTSSWQEDVKNDRTWTWDEYVGAVRDPSARGRSPARRFWLTQDLPSVLATWSGVVPVERVHVVTVPPPGADSDELHRRMASVVGYRPEALTKAPAWDNSSLGVAGTEVVRRLNLALGRRLDQRQHDHVVKSVIVPYLVRYGTDARYAVPTDELGWLTAEAERHIDAVRSVGYPVSGDLADLLPQAAGTTRRPDDVTSEELADTAVLALTGLAERHATFWEERQRDETPRVEPTDARVRATSAMRGLRFRARRTAAALADRSDLAARLANRYVSRRRP